MKSPQVKKSKYSLLLLIGALALIVGGAAWGFLYFQKTKVNYAQQTAEPLEEALVDAGAVKVCSKGDAGRGTDNRKPGYSATLKTNLSKADAISLVDRVANENGYKLGYKQSPYSYISWYSDDSTKRSPHKDLQSGSVGVSMNIYSGGDNLSCDNTQLDYDENHVAIVLTVGLPEFK